MSLILFGDNGTGKSTLVDAVEWAVRGSIRRRGVLGKVTGPKPRSAFGGVVETSVEVEFSNGSKCRRIASFDDNNNVLTDPKEPHETFRLAPVALKRANLVEFFEAEGPERR